MAPLGCRGRGTQISDSSVIAPPGAWLTHHGIDRVFCVPGESYLDIIDGLYDARQNISLIACRHEAAAANMAVAYGKLTGRPGVCLVSRGPGASHAAIGVHIAAQDSTPMVLLVGQVPRGHRGRESFQELDYKAFFGSTARWVGEANDCSELPELVARAFHYAMGGRPGPVVLSLPEDVLSSSCEVDDVPLARSILVAPPASALRELSALLAEAERPLVIAGGGNWTRAASDSLEAVTSEWALPVAASFRSQDVLDNRSDTYVGNMGVGGTPNLARHVAGADLLVAVGTRLDDLTVGGYSIITAPRPRQRLVHVFPDAGELGRVFTTNLAIATTPEPFLAAWKAQDVVTTQRRVERTRLLRAAYIKGREGSSGGPVDLAQVVRHVSEVLPDDAIITNGAGNYTAWVHRYFQFKQLGTQLAPIAGAMGFGVPAAIAAKAVYPERIVVCFAGDGCFLMSGQELATAVQYGLAIIVIVINNDSYGTIRSHQQRKYPGRLYGTDLSNPDFVAYARSFGINAELAVTTDDFISAFDRARKSPAPTLIEVRVDASLRLSVEN